MTATIDPNGKTDTTPVARTDPEQAAYVEGFRAAIELTDDLNHGVVCREPVMIQRVVYEPPCDGCGTMIGPAELAMVSSDATAFYCFSCVTMTFEAMKAAVEGGAR